MLLASSRKISASPDDEMYLICGAANSFSPDRLEPSDTVLVDGVRSKDPFARNTASICEIIWNSPSSRPLPGLRGAPR